MPRFNETEKKIRKMIMDRVLAEGSCPSTAELAEAHSLSPDQLAAALKNLEAGLCVAIQNRQHENIKHFQDQRLDVPPPKLGEIFYARPFATFKNHYPVWVDGDQKWYGECAVEVCGISMMFPGKEVAVQSVCRQTGEPVEIVGRDGKLLHYSPKTLRVHIGIPIRYFPDDAVGWCDYNSFFSSEEAVKQWKKKHPRLKGITRSPEQMAAFIVNLIGKGRLDYNYQFNFPVLTTLWRAHRYGFTKPQPILKYFWPDPFWLPTPYFFSSVKRNGYRYYLRVSMF
jgi:hypothetical protein